MVQMNKMGMKIIKSYIKERSFLKVTKNATRNAALKLKHHALTKWKKRLASVRNNISENKDSTIIKFFT